MNASTSYKLNTKRVISYNNEYTTNPVPSISNLSNNIFPIKKPGQKNKINSNSS